MKKKDSLIQSNNGLNFWLCAGLLVALLASIMARDINRPFYGLHSWAEASGAWAARSHIKYGLGYTKGMSTWAVGDPPTENPQRYLDHPQLAVLTLSLFMRVFGVNEWSYRLLSCTASLLILILFLKILKGLLDDKTALLAGLIYVLFPITGYFGAGGWPTLMGFSAIWCYLVLIRSLKDGPEPKPVHKLGLAVSLFLTLQFGWTGFFYAFAIGVHYVARCVFRKQLPDKSLLAILIFAPLSSLTLNFTIMAGGYRWDFSKIVELYKWRAAKGEMQVFEWWGKDGWFPKFWEFALTNFTLPILITAIVYLTFGQLFVFMETKPSEKNKRRSRQFPQFWLFVITPMSQLLILRGALWKHQTWERPLGPFIAIATALGVMLLGDLLRKINRRLAVAGTAVLVGVFFVFCVIGTNYYYGIRWQAPAKIKMFKMLNQKIPPDKALLSFEPFIVHQHKAKGAFYRPEIAWYLDRDIVPVRIIKDGRIMVVETMKEIQQKAETGKYPYYLVPTVDSLSPLISQLRKNYTFEYIQGEPGETKNGKFYRGGMMPYLLFDLRSKSPVS